MSMRSTGFFVSSAVAPTVISFNKADLQFTGQVFSVLRPIVFSTAALNLTGQRFIINRVTIEFNAANLQLNGKTFSPQRGIINYDNGFMAF